MTREYEELIIARILENLGDEVPKKETINIHYLNEYSKQISDRKNNNTYYIGDFPDGYRLYVREGYENHEMEEVYLPCIELEKEEYHKILGEEAKPRTLRELMTKK